MLASFRSSAHLDLQRALLRARTKHGDECILYLSAGAGLEPIVSTVLDCPCLPPSYPTLRTENGNGAMHAAVASHSLATCMLLLEKTKLTHSGEQSKNGDGITPLECGRTSFRQQLIDREAEGSYAAFLSHVSSGYSK